MQMDVKEAVARAKAYVSELFGYENISNLGLEEVEFDQATGDWLVTVGFSRPWDTPAVFGQQPQRSYKVLRISDLTGTALSVRNRETSVT